MFIELYMYRYNNNEYYINKTNGFLFISEQ